MKGRDGFCCDGRARGREPAVVMKGETGGKSASSSMPFRLAVIKLEKLGYEKQLELIGNTSLMIDMHGAGIASAMHICLSVAASLLPSCLHLPLCALSPSFSSPFFVLTSSFSLSPCYSHVMHRL